MLRTAQQFLAGLLMMGVAFIPAVQAQQQSSQAPNVRPAPGGPGGTGGGGYSGVPAPPTTLSTATFQTAKQKMVTLQVQAAAGHGLKAADVASAATALQNVFANMDETGYTAKVQAWVLANPTLFTTQNPTTAELQTAYASLGGTGITETYAQFVQRITGASLDTRQMFITQVQTNGLDYVHSQIIAAMNATANSADLLHQNGGHLVRVVRESPSWWAVGAEYLAIVGVSMAVIAAAPAVVIAIGVAGAAAGAVDLFES